MEIEYQDHKVQKYCLDNRLALSKFGTKVAKRLQRTIAVVYAASNMADVKAVLPKSHWLEGNRHWQISIPLADGKSLVLEALNKESREWAKHNSMIIQAVEDYHK